jgi:hypothetical protein
VPGALPVARPLRWPRCGGICGYSISEEGLCVGHDERDGDSAYEAGDVRQKNSSGTTGFHQRQGAPMVGDAYRAILQQEKGEGRHMVNQFVGTWEAANQGRGRRRRWSGFWCGDSPPITGDEQDVKGGDGAVLRQGGSSHGGEKQ